jgi:hypothetical protein
MQRLQNALTKQLTDEHERIDLKLREKVTYLNILQIYLGRGSKKDQKEERRGRCLALRCATLVGQDANYL